MAVKIKLKRLGKIREPHYRIVVADARTKRDGRAIEEIGTYYPKAEPSLIEVNSERAQHWLSVGAKPTDPVRVLLKITGDWQKFTGEPGTEGTLRTAEPRADKKERFTAAAKESQATKEAKEDQGEQGRDPVQGGQARQGRPGQGQCAQGHCAKDSAPKDSAPKDSCAQGHCAQGRRAPRTLRPRRPPAKDDAAKADAAKAEAAKARKADGRCGRQGLRRLGPGSRRKAREPRNAAEPTGEGRR